ncbi:hypothetical protein [Streptomyces sp. WMMC1477]|uniref:hypothetical protein n=1 Tax=unclassified Streptomyces TaxID=2593676 RepID=UPI003FCCF74C
MSDSDSDPPLLNADGTTLLDVVDAPRAVAPPVPADRDPVATYYCKTLKQVHDVAYDIVIVRGGAAGAAVLDRLMKRDDKSAAPRVLVFEQGSFLLPEHVQNLRPRYQRLIKDAVARSWRRSIGPTFDLAPQIPYLGGRAQFWSTWIPRPTDARMPNWPKSVKESLGRYWDSADAFLGAVRGKYVVTGTNISGTAVPAYATSVPGVFATGDVRYRGVRRIAMAAGEGAAAALAVPDYFTGRSQVLQTDGGTANAALSAYYACPGPDSRRTRYGTAEALAHPPQVTHQPRSQDRQRHGRPHPGEVTRKGRTDYARTVDSPTRSRCDREK